jgi:hypothetical protein
VQRIELRKWSILSDPELTEDVYALIETGGAELCGCECCFNFAIARHLVWSAQALELLETLGIDPLLESVVSHQARLRSGLHVYTGCFHLVGEIASGPATPVALRGGRPASSLLALGAGLELGFTADRSSAPEAFYGLPVVRLEFRARIPWISNAPEPGRAARRAQTARPGLWPRG